MQKYEKVIEIRNLKKQYRLGTIGGGTLRADLQSWWAKKRGLEDPNTMIGTDQRQVGERFWALKGVDLDIYKGETLGIIGANGAGKSTLLKLLSRVTAPSEGSIKIRGRISSMLEVGTGFHGELSGRENVYMNGAILGMTRKEVDAKIEDIIDFSECRQFIDTPVKRYSSGMYVKLAFSVAAHLDAEIMIMDEVLAVGDMKFQEKCLNKMSDSSRLEGRTILYVSHNMNTIRQLCQKCIVLSQGEKVYEGNVENAIQLYMGNMDRDKAIMDLSKIKREGTYINGKVKMNLFEILDYAECLFSYNTKLKCRLCYCSEIDVDDVLLRIRVHCADGTPVTMMTADNVISIKKGEKGECLFVLDLEHIVPGKYMLGIVMYHLNQYGNDGPLDGLDDFITIEIADDPDFNNQMEWRRKYWGSVSLHSLQLLR